MRRRGESNGLFAEINMVPFNDVLLVLLVIFMLTATFLVAGAGLDISLPRARTAAPLEHRQVLIVLDKSGKVFVEGREAKVDEIPPLLSRLAESEPDIVAIVAADREVPYGRVVGVLDAVRLSGVKYLALAAQPEGEVKLTNVPRQP